MPNGSKPVATAESAPSWELTATGRCLPLPKFPEIPRGDDSPHGPEITAIAGALWCAFHHCAQATTEEKAGNHFLVLAHGKLHRRLDDLRDGFLQKARAAGVSYSEAAEPFDGVVTALGMMKNVATLALFQQNGKRRTSKAVKRAADSVEAEYIRNVVKLNRLLGFISAPAAATHFADQQPQQFEWTKPALPSHWAGVFECDVRTLRGMIEKGTIVAEIMTSKRWRIAIDSLPAKEKDKHRSAK